MVYFLRYRIFWSVFTSLFLCKFNACDIQISLCRTLEKNSYIRDQDLTLYQFCTSLQEKKSTCVSHYTTPLNNIFIFI